MQEKYIYAITEKSVDGDNEDVTLYAKSENPLTDTEENILHDCLLKAKHDAITTFDATEECFDTESITKDALKLFVNQTGTSLTLTENPLSGIIEF